MTVIVYLHPFILLHFLPINSEHEKILNKSLRTTLSHMQQLFEYFMDEDTAILNNY